MKNMNFLPNTTCRRCHRQYPSFRRSCPYCGTKKVKEVRSAVPETDSAVSGTRAAKAASEAVNWQMLIGGVLLLVVTIVTITVVSVNVRRDVNDQQLMEQQQALLDQTTPLPPPTPTPSPTPSAPPQITQLQITWPLRPGFDYNGNGFNGSVGETYDFDVTWFPREVLAEPEWTSSDESIATVDSDGVIKLVGAGECTIYVQVNEKQGVCPVYVHN